MARYKVKTNQGFVEFDSPHSDLSKEEVSEIINKNTSQQPIQQQSTPPGLVQRAFDFIGKQVPTAQGGALSPQSLLADVPDLVQKGADVIAEKTATTLAGPGLQVSPFSRETTKTSPETAAAIGTGISLAPNIAMGFMGPAPLASDVSNIGASFSRRALGIPKRMMGTGVSRSAAQEAGKVALEKDILSLSPETMLRKAEILNKQSGGRIGRHLRKQGIEFNVNDAISNLDKLKEQITGGKRGGLFEPLVKQIDDAQETLLAIVEKGDKGSFQAANKVKNLVGKTVNFTKDIANQETTRSIYGNIKKSIDNALQLIGNKSNSISEYNQFLKNKKLYGASSTMMEGLNDLLSKGGNQLFGLKSVVAGGGALGSGQPLKALGALGAVEGMMRGGSVIAARNLARAPRGGEALIQAIRSNRKK